MEKWKGESSKDCVGSNITIKGIEGEGGVGREGGDHTLENVSIRF